MFGFNNVVLYICYVLWVFVAIKYKQIPSKKWSKRKLSSLFLECSCSGDT